MRRGDYRAKNQNLALNLKHCKHYFSVAAFPYDTETFQSQGNPQCWGVWQARLIFCQMHFSAIRIIKLEELLLNRQMRSTAARSSLVAVNSIGSDSAWQNMTAASLIDKRLSLYGWKWGRRRRLLRFAQQLPPFFVWAWGKFPPLMRTRAPIKQGQRGSSMAVLVNIDARWLRIKINFFALRLIDPLKHPPLLFFHLQGLIADRSSSSSTFSGPHQCCCT